MISIAVIGSRNFKELDMVNLRLMEIRYGGANPNEVTIISGGAVGVDSRAILVAEAMGFKTRVHKPQYDKWGDDAPHIRNDLIISEADKVITFWNGECKSGTYSVISKCLAKRKDIEVIFD